MDDACDGVPRGWWMDWILDRQIEDARSSDEQSDLVLFLCLALKFGEYLASDFWRDSSQGT